MNLHELTEDDINYRPTLDDLDPERAYTDPEHRAATAQLVYLTEQRDARRARRKSQLGIPLLAALLPWLEQNGDAAGAERARQGLDEMRTDALLAEAHSEIVLERFSTAIARLEFVIVAARCLCGEWPTPAEAAHLYRDVFDEHIDAIGVLNLVTQTPGAWPGIFWLDGAQMSDWMADETSNRLTFRLCVSAERQLLGQLHEAYELWAYDNPFEPEES